MKNILSRIRTFLGAKTAKEITTPKRQLSQYWVGHFATEKVFAEFFEEAYTDDDDAPLSRFVASQGETWIDHDFMESHVCGSMSVVKEELFFYASRKDWIQKLERHFAKYAENSCYVLVMSSFNIHLKENKIINPKSHKEEGIELVFLGEGKSAFE